MIPPKYWSPTRKLMLLGAMAGGKTVEATALGNPLTFITDKAKPLKSLLIPFTPVQSGTGDPSPENIRSILPWNGLTVFGGGKNLLKIAESEMVSIGWNRYFPNTINKAGTYTISCKHPFGGTGNQGARVVLTNVPESSPQEIKLLTGWTFGQSSAGNKATFTLTEDEAKCAYILFECAGVSTGFDQFENAELQIEAGNTATAYEPYHPITETDISFPSPVYGGEHEAVSGKLKSAYLDFKFKWSDCTPNRIIGDYVERIYSHDVTCDSSSGGRGKCNVAPLLWTQAGMTRFYVNYENFIICLPADTPENTDIEICALARTPQEIQLTPAQITALLGNNTIWSDADGQMTAVYLKKG